MTLCTFLLISEIIAATGLISVVLNCITSHHARKGVLEKEENDTIIVQTVKYNKKLKTVSLIFRLTAIILLLIAITMIIYYSVLSKQALEHGSYDNIQNSQTISEIKYNIENGYVESENIPVDDMKNSIVIFFKYGCDDCTGIHNELMKYLTDKDMTNIYFVSSKSETGKQLLYPYGDKTRCLIKEVPSVAYYYEENGKITCRHENLYEYDEKQKIHCKTYVLDEYIKLQKNKR